MIENISRQFMGVIKNNSEGMTEEREEIIQYGLEVFIYEFLQTVILFTAAIFFGIFKQVFAYFIAYGILRAFTGGSHARTRLQCIFTYLVIITFVLFISKYLWVDNIFPVLVLFVVELAVLLKYTPGDTEEKPILSTKMKRRLRISAIITIVLIFSVSFVLHRYDRILSNIIILSTLPVMLLLSPIGYKIFKCKHGSAELQSSYTK